MISEQMEIVITEILEIKDSERRLLNLKQFLSGFKAHFEKHDTDYTRVATQIYINELRRSSHNKR
jgi:hypothetical protein